MYGERSRVYGLKHQARCMIAVPSETNNKFIAGTCSIHKNNSLALLSLDQDESELFVKHYSHPEEVWHLSIPPNEENMVMTCHTDDEGSSKGKASLWRMRESDRTEDGELQYVMSLPQANVQSTLWDPNGNGEKVVTCSRNGLNIWEVNSKLVDTNASDNVEATGNISTAFWSTHQPEIVYTSGRNLRAVDVRSKSQTFQVVNAHKDNIKAIDGNPNKPYNFATGGEDGVLKIWDTRNLKGATPALVLSHHSHWIYSVAFNRAHDQLLLTSGSDNTVNLENVISVSSAAYTAFEDDNDEDGDGSSQSAPVDGLVRTYEQHEDSVYAAAWSYSDVWTFASLSYDGRIVVNSVPQEERLRLLGV